MRFNYKAYPLHPPNPAFPTDQFLWHPVLPVRLNYPSRHASTPRFEAWVDSGSPDSYFQASIGRSLGIRIENGVRDALGGIIQGPRSEVFFHNVGLFVGTDFIKIRAGSIRTSVRTLVSIRTRSSERRGQAGGSCLPRIRVLA